MWSGEKDRRGKRCRVERGKIGRSNSVARFNCDSIVMMPALQQIRSIEFPLLAAQLFLLIDAALAAAQSFKHVALAISLMVFAGRLLSQQFELADLRLE